MHQASLFLLFYLVSPQAPIPNDSCSEPAEMVDTYVNRSEAEAARNRRGGKLIEVNCEPAVHALARPHCSAHVLERSRVSEQGDA